MSTLYSPLLPAPLLLPPQYGFYSLFAFWMGGAGLYETPAFKAAWARNANVIIKVIT